jgi:hypothetical protein
VYLLVFCALNSIHANKDALSCVTPWTTATGAPLLDSCLLLKFSLLKKLVYLQKAAYNKAYKKHVLDAGISLNHFAASF